MIPRLLAAPLAVAIGVAVAGCSSDAETMTADTVTNASLKSAFDHAAGENIATDEQAHDLLLVIPAFQIKGGNGYALDTMRELQGQIAACPKSVDRDNALQALDKYFTAAANTANLLTSYEPQADASTYSVVTDSRYDLRRPAVGPDADFGPVACSEDFLSMTSWTSN